MLGTLKRWFGFGAPQLRPAARQTFKSFKPRLEVLEERETPAVFTWTGAAGDGLWGTAGNWASAAGGTPGAGDTAKLDNTAMNANVSINQNVTVQEIDLFNGYAGTVTISSSATLTVTNKALLESGELKGGKVVISAGGEFVFLGGTRSGLDAYQDQTIISPNATLNIKAQSEVRQSSVLNYGTANLVFDPNTSMILNLTSDARFVNEGGSVFNYSLGAGNSATIQSDSSYTEFAIQAGATFNQTKPTLSVNASLFNNWGTINLSRDAADVVLEITKAGTISGQVSLGANTKLLIEPNDAYTVTLAGANVTGQGSLVYNDQGVGSELQVAGNSTVQNFTQSGGATTLNGSGTLTITGQFTLSGGGVWSGSITIVINPNALLVIDPGAGNTFSMLGDASLDNWGTVQWRSGSIVVGGATGSLIRIKNETAAIFEIWGDLTLTFNNEGEVETFWNAGRVKKVGGAANATLGLHLDNVGGTVDPGIVFQY